MKALAGQAHMLLGGAHASFISWRLAIFLVLCLGLGGTSLYVPTLKIPLYYISVAFIGHALITQTKSIRNLFRPSILLGAILIALYCLYIIPLPPSIWTALPGREFVMESFALINSDLPWLPLSLVPRQTFESIFSFLPIIAIALIMCISASEDEIKNAEKAIVVTALISFSIGFIEVLSGVHVFSVYEFYSAGFPVGFFTNINHQATLSSIALPLAIYFTFKQKAGNQRRNNALFFFGAASSIMLVLCLILTRSSAGYLFLVLNLCLSLSIMMSGKRYSILFIILILVALLTLVVDFVFFQSQFQTILGKITSQSGTSRKQIFITSIEAARSFGIFGAGPGSFEAVYRIFENQEVITKKYVNEAHNEYIQMWIEFGILGILWLFAAFVWFFGKIWSFKRAGFAFRKQHLIYVLCISTIALHSVVDFPLRTIAMSSIFAFLIIRFDQFRPKHD